MIVQYIKKSTTSNNLIMNKKYIVYAYEKSMNKEEKDDTYWVLNEEDLFEMLHEKDIKMIDDTHSIYWVVLTSRRSNIYCYYPKVWLQGISEEFYDDRMDEIEGFWYARDNIIKSPCGSMVRGGDCTYIKLINNEYPNFFNECNQDDLDYKAEIIEDNWVFCPIEICKESFEVLVQNCIVFCPKCLTKMYNPLYGKREEINQPTEQYIHTKLSKNRTDRESVESLNKYYLYDEIYTDLSKLFKRHISSKEKLEILLEKISNRNGGISIRNIRHSLDKFKDKNISYTKEEIDMLNDLMYLLGG